MNFDPDQARDEHGKWTKGGGHEAHAVGHVGHEVHLTHELHEAMEAAHGVADAHAILAREVISPAVKHIANAMSKTPGLRMAGEALSAMHDKLTNFADELVKDVEHRYGAATAAAIFASGAFAAAAARHSVGGGALAAIPGQRMVGALPVLALAEAGKRVGLLGPDSQIERGLRTVGGWVHATRATVGKPFKWAGDVGLRASYLAGYGLRYLGTNADLAEELLVDMHERHRELLVEYGPQLRPLLRKS